MLKEEKKKTERETARRGIITCQESKKKSHNFKYPRVPLVFPTGSERKIWQ